MNGSHSAGVAAAGASALLSPSARSSGAPDSRGRRRLRRARNDTVDRPVLADRQTAGLALLFLLALALRVVWIVAADVEPNFEDDTGRYQALAESLADGHGYVLFNDDPTAFVPVGYPATLAAVYSVVGNHYEAALALNALAGAATAVLTFFLASQVAGKRAAWLAGIAVAVFPSQVFFSSLTMTEVPYTALALTIILALLAMIRGSMPRWPVLLAFGFLLGYASLMRGETVLLPVIAATFIGARGGSWSTAGRWLALVLIGMAAAIAPWTVRNMVEMRAFVPLSTHAGVTLWVGHHEGATGRFVFADELFAQVEEELVKEGGEPDAVDFETRANQVGVRESVQFALSNPLEEVRLTGVKLWSMFNNDREAIYWNETHGSRPFLDQEPRSRLLTLSDVTYFFLLASFVIGVLLWLSEPNVSGAFLLAVLAYWTAAHVMFIGDARYHFSMVPIMAVFATIAWTAAGAWGRQAAQRFGVMGSD
ncbi:MAG: glycosyltransferase family 39 protein [Dehalococcoidia bacterium]